MPTRLIASEGGPDITVNGTLILVGRHSRSDVRIELISVSERHCCLLEYEGEVLVRDLGSTNGTRINGERVETGRLRPGDELMIGFLRYRVGAR